MNIKLVGGLSLLAVVVFAAVLFSGEAQPAGRQVAHKENSTIKMEPSAAPATASAPAQPTFQPTPHPPGTVEIQGGDPNLKYYQTPDGAILIEGKTLIAKHMDGSIKEMPVNIKAVKKMAKFSERKPRGAASQPAAGAAGPTVTIPGK